MTDTLKPTEAEDKKKDDDVLEPDEVIFDAAETAFLQAKDEEPAKK